LFFVSILGKENQKEIQ